MWYFLFILYTLSAFTAAAAVSTEALNARQSFAMFSYRENPTAGQHTLMIKAKKDTSGIALRFNDSKDSPRNITILRKKECAGAKRTEGGAKNHRCQNRPEPVAQVVFTRNPSGHLYTCTVSVAPVSDQDASNDANITFSTKSAALPNMASPIVDIIDGRVATITYNLPQDIDGNTRSIRVSADLDDLPQFFISGETNASTTFRLVYDKDAPRPRREV